MNRFSPAEAETSSSISSLQGSDITRYITRYQLKGVISPGNLQEVKAGVEAMGNGLRMRAHKKKRAPAGATQGREGRGRVQECSNMGNEDERREERDPHLAAYTIFTTR